MSARHDNGGCAFPSESTPSMHQMEDGKTNRWPFSPGMSLRDYFAAKAMQSLMSNIMDGGDAHFVACAHRIGPAAYELADHMLKARAS